MAKQEDVNSNGNLDECCAPLLFWLRLIGIPIIISKPSQGFRFLIILYGLLLFLTTIGNSAFTIYWVFRQLEESLEIAIPEVYSTSTFRWSYAMEVFNQVFITVGAQLGLLVSSLQFLPRLFDIFRKIKGHNLLTIGEYRRIHKFSRIGLTIVLLDALIYQMIVFVSCFLLGLRLPLLAVLITVKGAFEMVYPTSGYVLFICFGYISILMIETLSNNITHNKDIEWCKRGYLLISEWIDQLNKCFGFILVVLITGVFIRTISTSFFVVTSLKYNNDFSFNFFIQIWILLREFGAVFATTYVSRKMQLETKRMIVCCLKLRQLNDSILQTKIDLFAIEISNTVPNFTAMDLFDVDLKLIPKVIGTTLTYLIILFQFQTSEKK